MLTDIIDDADYLIQTHHDITTPGSYTDGDLSNSSYDLMDDMQKILKLFLKEPHQYD